MQHASQNNTGLSVPLGQTQAFQNLANSTQKITSRKDAIQFCRSLKAAGWEPNDIQVALEKRGYVSHMTKKPLGVSGIHWLSRSEEEVLEQKKKDFAYRQRVKRHQLKTGQYVPKKVGRPPNKPVETVEKVKSTSPLISINENALRDLVQAEVRKALSQAFRGGV